ncbi:MAG: hypothetical protein KKC75_04150 [Nanoarchaeota archaeon]|nr:hypothetical protein [Nanoarchaeota archaeon]MBU1005348.1 hypothetical protein [Nanoarchaeota archaeon]MBU1946096.1 hypothetical protein [Nanoarchaeota archaeon]
MENLKVSKDNKESRMNFVKYWADYVRSHPDKVWSRQQNILINSQLQGARALKLTPKDYLRVKGELR